jgi:hypothetical protein
VTFAQSIYFAFGLRATEFVFVLGAKILLTNVRKYFMSLKGLANCVLETIAIEEEQISADAEEEEDV